MITREHAYKLRKLIEKACISLNDEEALEGVELFPQWVTDKAYEVSDRVKFENVLYKCVQAHTSQADWTPDVTPALWVKVSIEEYPDWVQPIGTQDSYMTGDKVSHKEKHWVSTIDNNVWEPSVYGWDEI